MGTLRRTIDNSLQSTDRPWRHEDDRLLIMDNRAFSIGSQCSKLKIIDIKVTIVLTSLTTSW